jgi:hypothetical protein
MWRPAEFSNEQLRLPLIPTEPLPALPPDKQKDLVLALVEMLVNAAREKEKRPAIGGKDESQTHL